VKPHETQIPPQVQNQIAQTATGSTASPITAIQKSQMETLQKESELALEEVENSRKMLLYIEQ
jgi:prefoldin beta subunit